MKIGVDAREFVEKGKTGIRRYLENLLTPLIREAGLDFILFVNRREFIPEILCPPSVKMVALPALPTIVVDQAILPCLARREKVDVFFSPYYKIPLFGPFKRIIVVHDIMFLRQKRLNPLARFLIACELRSCARQADIIIAISDFTSADLSDFMPQVKHKIYRLHPGLDSNWLAPVEPAGISRIRETHAGGNAFFLYVGNFKPHKNVDLLVQAFTQLVKAGDAAGRRLLLVGGDLENHRRIETLIFKCGMERNIILFPNVSDADLRGLYAAADWFITASAFEGFGYPVLEAMARGCPVICQRNTAIAEVVGTAALEIASLTVAGIRNALQRACRLNAAARKEFVEKGIRQAKRFAPGTAAVDFSALLTTLERG
ncbi:MAG: glycosyltransferase family 4 protein [Lentisphaerae bacterium]|nr:glycosyltransferase family 4 protein [Lentisphaerota bacterium]